MSFINIFCIIILILLLLETFMHYSKFENLFSSNSNIKYYDYGFPFAKHKICFIGSVHGNEPAGCVALTQLINDGFFNNQKNIFIRVIPCVNEWGLKINTRYQPNLLHPDINRNFDKQPLDTISYKIAKLIEGMDWVIDIHEGYDFHLLNPKSVGSTLSPSPHPESQQMANIMVQNINQTIRDPEKKFTVLYNNSCKIKKTLACYRLSKNKKYILIEITGQSDIQPINLRKAQAIILIKEFMNQIKKNI